MRVIAGEAKGRRLKAPSGATFRPSAERVRAALFSMLEASGVEMGRVLDLYAGTGAIGIEALSRGAGWADFVERDRAMARAISENLMNTRLEERGQVHVMDAGKAVEALSGPYDVIFMDPPYADESVDRVVDRIGEMGLCGEDGVVIVEHARRRPLEGRYRGLALQKEKSYGDTMLSIFQMEESL